MIAISPGYNLHIGSWITGYLLAASFILLQTRTRGFAALATWMGRLTPSPFWVRNSRRITYTFLVALLGAFLAFLMSQDPLRAGILTNILNIAQSDIPNIATFFLDDILVASAFLGLLICFPLVNVIFARMERGVRSWQHGRIKTIRIQKLELLTREQIARILTLGLRYTRYATIGMIFSVFVMILFSLYPLTQGLAQALIEAIGDALTTVWKTLIDFLPKLVMLGVIFAITRLSLRVLRFFYYAVRRDKVRIPGVDAEIAEPTFQLARFFVIALALVAAFPFIPGSDSPVFKGISIFIGFLLSMGSTSLVSNIVAGIVLTYTRGLRIGDRVAIGDTVGDVIDRTLLVTRLRTIKNVIVSIPHSIVLQHEVINYSMEASDRGLILHTEVTIGYDVPWQTVQRLLIAAARQTKYIVNDPEPFVLQTALEDYYVRYQLNAYTREASKMATIYSELHYNILDSFHTAKVEITSPAYMAVRDGNEAAIPVVENASIQS